VQDLPFVFPEWKASRGDIGDHADIMIARHRNLSAVEEQLHTSQLRFDGEIALLSPVESMPNEGRS